ncbi:MAPEG family protein [Gammaproteobacteria bacterium]|nr:MAPEG family protein [Gammaproteobacteria bacterium]
MIALILYTALLYLIQIITAAVLRERASAAVKSRADNAVHNLRESLPVFFALAILSIHLDVDANFYLAAYWLIARIIYAVIYITGIGLQSPKEGSTYVPQPVRGLVWFISIALLVNMGINLI